MDGGRVRALVEAELRATLRERIALASLGLVCLLAGGAGAGGQAIQQKLHPRRDDDAGPVPTYDCEPGVMPKVAFAGDLPPWIVWPDPTVPVEEATILVTVLPPTEERQQIEVTRLDPTVSATAVEDCLDKLRVDERDARLAKLGVTEEPGNPIDVVTLAPEPLEAGPALPISAGISVIAGIGAVLGALFADLGPRARASGWLETLIVLPGARADIVAAWSALGFGAATIATALILVGDRLAVWLTGLPTSMVPLAYFPPLIFVLVAIAVRAWLDAQDLRAAAVYLVPVVMVILLLTGVAQLIEARLPGMGAAVPVGGLMLVVAGKIKGALLASTTAVGAGVLLLFDSVQVLETTVVRSGPMGTAATRRATGDYRPEAALLVLIAIAGVASWAPPELVMHDVTLQTLLTMVLFLATPAIATGGILRLDRRELLSWRAPRWHAFLLVPMVVAGTLSLGGLMWRIGVWLFPDASLIALLNQTIGEMDSTLGLFTLSVVPGICEELMFRGAILGLLRKKLPSWMAILIQAAAFAVLHSLAVRLPHTFVLGVLFGILTVRTGSLWPAMLAHAAHNLSSTLLPQDQLAAWATSSWAYLFAALGVVAVLIAGPPRRAP